MAASRGVEALRELLAREPGLAQQSDSSGQTTLHAVCSAPGCDADAVVLLLQKTQDVNATDKHQWTALHCAAKNASLQVVDALLQAPGIAVDARNVEGTAPLHYLARRPESEHLGRVMSRLDKLGANFGATNAALETPLHLACAGDGCCRLLLAHGADANALNKKGETPLHYAARSGRTAVAEMLLDAGARLEAGEHGTPLAVVDPSHPELVQLLNQATQRPLNASRGSQLRSSVAGTPRMRPGQRKLDHVVGLAVREMRAPLRNSILTVHLGKTEPPVLVVEGPSDTRNPEWDLDGTRACSASCAAAATDDVGPARTGVFWICVWDGPDELVMKRRVSLGELVYIGHEVSELHVVFPARSLVLELVDGFYAEEATVQELAASARLPSLQPPKVMTAESYTLAEFAQLIQGAQQHRDWAAETRQLQQTLSAALAARGADSVAGVAHRDVRLLALHTRRAQLQEQLEEERMASAQCKQEVAASCSDILQGRSWIGAADANLEECARRTLPELDNQNAALRSATHDLHASMLRQLRAIFPVEQQASGGWCICGIRLPNSDSFGGCDVELVATALGYVCHVVHVVARWLGVTLRYDVLPMSSRSIIRDDISVQGSGSAKFPLYARGVDRTRFEYGVFLLNKDIEQLLQSQHVSDIEPLKNTLPNLHKLLNLI